MTVRAYTTRSPLGEICGIRRVLQIKDVLQVEGEGVLGVLGLCGTAGQREAAEDEPDDCEKAHTTHERAEPVVKRERAHAMYELEAASASRCFEGRSGVR